jgi:hypothetical protein
MNRRAFLAGIGLAPVAIVPVTPTYHTGGIVSAAGVPQIMPPCETVINARGADMGQVAKWAREIERAVAAKMSVREVRNTRA